MKGDYYRYMCEIVTGERLQEAKAEAAKCYSAAEKLNVHFGSSTRLCLCLNMAVFQAEVKDNYTEAIKVLERALQDAADKVEELQEDDLREAKEIMEIMKDNIDAWKEHVATTKKKEEEAKEKMEKDLLDMEV